MIVTFYSYKGGVGRSMALANVGEILSARGFRVVMVDFDLEAPGLERYVVDGDRRGGDMAALEAKPGVMDLLADYKEVLRQPPRDAPTGEAKRRWVRMGELWVPRPSSYAIPVGTADRRPGSLHLITAGRRDKGHRGTYAERVRRFDWQDFYQRWNGDLFMDLLRGELAGHVGGGDGRRGFADVVLVDSRTGVTEHGGICTHHLADLVVLLSATNDVNIAGTRWMAEALSRPELRAQRGGRKLRLIPVASRVEQQAEKDQLVDFRRRFRQELDSYLVPELRELRDGASREEALDREIPYMPFYSFRERVVAREEPAEREEKLYRAYQRLARDIEYCGQKVFELDRRAADSDEGSLMLTAERIDARRRPESERFEGATGRYLQAVYERFRYLELKGLGVADRVPLRLELESVFVPLRARMHEKDRPAKAGKAGGSVKGETPDAELAGRGLRLASGEIGGRFGDLRPVGELLAEHDGLVLLGDPGSGKTTLLKQLALSFALGRESADTLGDRLPVVVPLAAFATALAGAGPEKLEAFAAHHAAELSGDARVAPAVGADFAAGSVLLLLDGLDEVRDADLRRKVADAIATCFARVRAAGNQLVVTSRVVGFREVALGDKGLAVATLADFDQEDCEAFITRWTAALEAQARGPGERARSAAEEEARDLSSAIAANESIRRLAANPLLLTILALMKRQGVTLPERRVELYEQYVRTLLSSWNRARSLARGTDRDVDVVGTIHLLAPLARWMHERDTALGLVPEPELHEKVCAIVAGQGADDPAASARGFLADVADYAGLLIERGPRQFGFIHLTFEEYLAAVGIALEAEGDVGALFAAVAPKIGDAVWREPILLLVGYISLVQRLPKAAGRLLGRLLADRPGPPGMAVVLAAEAVLDVASPQVEHAVRGPLVEALVEVVHELDVPLKLRAQAGDALGRLGDPRPGVGTENVEGKDVPAIEWCEVPAGSFLMGSEDDEENAYDDEKPRHALELPRFWIARYPITNAQYRPFVEAGGYRDPTFWSEEGQAWLAGHDASELDAYEDNSVRKNVAAWLARRPPPLRDRPFYWDDRRWAAPNRPVVGITWYEARAFGRWLEAKRQAGVLDLGDELGRLEGYRIGLPSEAEWEKAARGKKGRRWPWGHAFAPDRVNSEEAGLGETSAVGLFPRGRSPFGAEEMAGNVWEWTRSRWGARSSAPDFTYPYVPGDGREDPHGRGLWILRGGSHFNTKYVVRCAARNRSLPDAWNLNLGFRLVFSLAEF